MNTFLKNLFRVGTVSSVNPEKCSARVTFASGTVSSELPILVDGALFTKLYWLPTVGEQVLTVSLPNGNAQGFIIGSFYSEKDGPPISNKNKRHVTFPDGTIIEYDFASKKLLIDAKGSVEIQAANTVTVIGNINVTGDVVADGISLKEHVHSGVLSGSSNTDKPVGGA